MWNVSIQVRGNRGGRARIYNYSTKTRAGANIYVSTMVKNYPVRSIFMTNIPV